VANVIPIEDVRHRIPYAVLESSSRPSVRETGLGVDLLIGLDGSSVLIIGGEGRVSMGPGRAVAIGPGLQYRLEGESTIGVLTLMAEIVHQARRTEHVRSSRFQLSQEYSPETGGNGSSGEANWQQGEVGTGETGPA